MPSPGSPGSSTESVPVIDIGASVTIVSPDLAKKIVSQREAYAGPGLTVANGEMIRPKETILIRVTHPSGGVAVGHAPIVKLSGINCWVTIF